MRILLFCSIALLGAGCSSDSPTRQPEPEQAAETAPAARPDLGTRVPSLMAGDVLDISVYGEPDLRMEVRIPEGGTFTYPLIGEVAAAGQSTSSLEASIRDRLAAEYLKEPQVTVNVKSFAVRKVYILGGVEKPNGYELLPDERITLLQLVSVAGGITDRAWKERIQIVRRHGGERQVIQLSLTEVEQAVAQGGASADVELWPEDLVVIPSSARIVYVLGAVQQPGSFELPLDQPFTVSQALSRAGSYTKFAATGKIEVLRPVPGGKPRKIPVDLDDITDGDPKADVVLEPGDVVWVPERGLF